MSDNDDMTLTLGIITLPMVVTNFSDQEGNNPLQAAVVELCSNVLAETTEKLQHTVYAMCKKHNIKYAEMSVQIALETARQALAQDDGTKLSQQFEGAMQDGKPVIDADYTQAKREGRSTKN